MGPRFVRPQVWVPVAVVAVAAGLVAMIQRDSDDRDNATPPELERVRAALIADDNPLVQDDLEITPAPLNSRALLVKGNFSTDTELSDRDLEYAVDLCDAVELPDGYNRVEIFNVLGTLAEGQPERTCRTGDYSSGEAPSVSDGGSVNPGEAELLTCPDYLEVAGPYRAGIDPEYDERMDWDGDGVSCE